MKKRNHALRFVEAACLFSSLAADYMVNQRIMVMGLFALLSAAGAAVAFS